MSDISDASDIGDPLNDYMDEVLGDKPGVVIHVREKEPGQYNALVCREAFLIEEGAVFGHGIRDRPLDEVAQWIADTLQRVSLEDLEPKGAKNDDSRTANQDRD